MAKRPALKAPYPYFGGKATIAAEVWARLGNVDNYVEPFAGSLAVLLMRPHAPKHETIGDLDSMVANFWRATQYDPEAVAAHADNPVNEVDLHARHRWLVFSEDAIAFRKRMRTDPDYYDAKIAGWWCWGASCWIGSGWCAVGAEEEAGEERSLWQQVPYLDCHGRGVNTLPNGQAALSQKRPSVFRPKGVFCGPTPSCADRRAYLLEWFGRLRDRLRTVRVCCGDWQRICSSPTTLTQLGLTGVFLDPPYSAAADREKTIYAHESATIAHDVRTWCLEYGGDRQIRACLAGYAGEGHEALEREGWRVFAWKAHGGYGNRSAKGQANARKERLWFSPHCLFCRDLFAAESNLVQETTP